MTWAAIATAPLDGTPVRIRGVTYLVGDEYEATACYTARRCPALCEGWFPPSDAHDGMGPYESVVEWRPLTDADLSA